MGLHWLVLVLLVAVFTCISLTENFPKGSDTWELLKTWHFMLGLTVFALAVLRLIVTLLSPTPLINSPIPRWQGLTAKVVQALLYASMFAMPLLGWLILSAAGKPIPFYGWKLLALIAENKGIAETVKEFHEAGGTVIYFLVGIHAVAAVYHHYFVRDNTLQRMLP